MRILIAHSRYLSGAVSGENRVVDDEARLLADAGHDVRTWQPEPRADGTISAARLGARSVWSRQAAGVLRSEIHDHRADIVHFHNVLPMLSPAAIRAARTEGVGVLVTLHNYRYECLPGTFLRDGAICEACSGRVPWPGVVHRCYRTSMLASAALASSLAVHRVAGTFQGVDRFLAVSEFLRTRYLAAGWDPQRVAVKANFAWPTIDRPRMTDAPYFVFAGRLSPEKGVLDLVRLWPDVGPRLVIAGGGPLAAEARATAPATVDFVGPVGPGELAKLVAGSRAVVVPSRWYEGQPRVVLEAFAAGVPTIVSDIGGLPELVRDGSGIAVALDSGPRWRAAIATLADPATSSAMGIRAKEVWQRAYSPAAALTNLERHYEDVLAGR